MGVNLWVLDNTGYGMVDEAALRNCMTSRDEIKYTCHSFNHLGSHSLFFTFLFHLIPLLWIIFCLQFQPVYYFSIDNVFFRARLFLFVLP